MPRIARAIAPGHPHHVTQRGNYGQQVFGSDSDFNQYLFWLNEYSRKNKLDIWAYCLMTNHVHFIAVPYSDSSMSRTFNSLHMRYSQYFNKKRKAKGHLWQGRYSSCVLDERHMYAAMRYVENNPVKARMVRNPHNYKWSSALAHVEGRPDPVLSGDCYLTSEIPDWLSYLTEKDNNSLTDNIRVCTNTGRPCGDESFVKRVEKMLGRSLMALPKGRPRKV